MTEDDLFVCSAPLMPAARADHRHICDHAPDYTRPMIDDHGRRNYPIPILLYRCAGCGVALTSRKDGGGRWARYIIEEEPW